MNKHDKILNEMLELAGLNEIKLGGTAVSEFIAYQAKEYVFDWLDEIDLSKAEEHFSKTLKERKEVDTALTMVEQIIANLKSQVKKM